MKFQRKKLSNGMVVIFEKRELPLVSVSISNKFGGAYEDKEIKGIAHFIEHLVFTGTKTRSHEEISREIEKKGGILNAFTAHEITSFWFKLPSEHLFSGLDILVDLLKNPKFNKEKFNKEKKVILEEIKMYKDDPQKHVYELIEKSLFEDPFGEGVIGNEKSVGNLERNFVYDYFKKVYLGNYIVSIVGDADFDKICDYLEKNFENIKINKQEVKIIKKNSDIVERREDISQANFIIGMHAPLFGEKDYYVLEVLDAYLADGMSSRIFLKIREERGLAYSVRSSIMAEKNYSYYLIYVGTTMNAVSEVKKIILDEFNAVNEMGLNELKEAKERVIGLRKVERENSSSVMQELVFAELVGNVENYYLYEDKINSVGLKEVLELSKRIIKEHSTAVILPK